MPIPVQITLILCATIITIVLILNAATARGENSWSTNQRLGTYKNFMSALADLKSDATKPHNWERLADAGHAISLIAPPGVVSAVMECCREAKASNGSINQATARNLLLTFRSDIGIPKALGHETIDFDIVPGRPGKKLPGSTLQTG